MEMLIVVAIIVILVAISIPMFSGSLDNAKEAADAANLRAANAVVVLKLSEGTTIAADAVFDISEGDFKTGTSATVATAEDYGQCADHLADSAYIKYDSTNQKAVWSNGGECGH